MTLKYLKNMKRIIKTITLFIGLCSIFVTPVFAGCDGWFPISDNCVTEPPYCSGSGCWLWEGFLATVRATGDHFSQKPISELAQDIVNFFLSFLSIVAVIYIMYAGFQLMTGAGDEEKMKKTKKIIYYVIFGIIIIWLSNSIVRWILNLVNGV
jgi:type IV secretory pathway VirB2 component (pilin)